MRTLFWILVLFCAAPITTSAQEQSCDPDDTYDVLISCLLKEVTELRATTSAIVNRRVRSPWSQVPLGTRPFNPACEYRWRNTEDGPLLGYAGAYFYASSVSGDQLVANFGPNDNYRAVSAITKTVSGGNHGNVRITLSWSCPAN